MHSTADGIDIEHASGSCGCKQLVAGPLHGIRGSQASINAVTEEPVSLAVAALVQFRSTRVKKRGDIDLWRCLRAASVEPMQSDDEAVRRRHLSRWTDGQLVLSR